MKRAADFTAEERSVIRARRKLQSSSELARVFGTSSQVIGAICARRMNIREAT